MPKAGVHACLGYFNTSTQEECATGEIQLGCTGRAPGRGCKLHKHEMWGLQQLMRGGRGPAVSARSWRQSGLQGRACNEVTLPPAACKLRGRECNSSCANALL